MNDENDPTEDITQPLEQPEPPAPAAAAEPPPVGSDHYKTKGPTPPPEPEPEPEPEQQPGTSILFDYRGRFKGRDDNDQVIEFLLSCRVFLQDGAHVCHVAQSLDGKDWSAPITVSWQGGNFEQTEQAAEFFRLPDSVRNGLAGGLRDRFALLAKSPQAVLR